MNKETLYYAKYGSKAYSRPQTDEELFATFSRLCRSFLRGCSIFGDAGDTDASSLCKQIQTLLQAFPTWPFSKKVANMNLDKLNDDALATFYSMCFLFLKEPLTAVVPHEHFTSEDAQRSFERGINSPSVDTLVMIADALKISADDILEDVLDYPHSSPFEEANNILMDCNPDEERMLISVLRFMKDLFSEFGI